MPKNHTDSEPLIILKIFRWLVVLISVFVHNFLHIRVIEFELVGCDTTCWGIGREAQRKSEVQFGGEQTHLQDGLAGEASGHEADSLDSEED